MSCLLRLLPIAALLAVLGISPAAAAAAYPALDTASGWSIREWGARPGRGLVVQGAGMNVWTAPGRAEARSVFYELAVAGLRGPGREYRFADPIYVDEWQASTYRVMYATFQPEGDLQATLVLYFHADGEFEIYAYLQGGAYVSGEDWQVLLRMDYDLWEAGDNVAELLWNRGSEGGSLGPPQAPQAEALDGRLVFSAEAPGPSYWAASGHEVAVAYPPLADPSRGLGPGIEEPAFARLTHAAHPRFGLLLFGDATTPVEAVFKAYGSPTRDLDPAADPAHLLQLAADGPGRPPYAYAGRDQVLHLRLKSPADGGPFRLRGKVFQRPDSRPLTVRVHQHPPERMGWSFDPDGIVREGAYGPRSFRRALEDLAAPADVTIAVSGVDLPYLPYEGFPAPGHPVSETDLHRLMEQARHQAGANPRTARDWQVDLFLVDWTLQGDPEAWEAMFDQGGADLNRIPREGAAVFWPALAGNGEGFRRGQAVLSALHGVGLALDMDPAWSDCPFAGWCWDDPGACGGVRCGSACPEGASGCRWSAHTCHAECRDGSIMSLTDITRNSLRFSREPAAGSPHSETDWYRRGPEAWVKPGRSGIAPVQGPALPPFHP